MGEGRTIEGGKDKGEGNNKVSERGMSLLLSET